MLETHITDQPLCMNCGLPIESEPFVFNSKIGLLIIAHDESCAIHARQRYIREALLEVAG